nr:hypothetical protein [uncultured Cohaesibacter sp.]
MNIDELRNLLQNPLAECVISQINDLDKRSRFRAYNAVRFLHWSLETAPISPNVSAFCALHATEEAVAAVISSAKQFGYASLASRVNLKDHGHKAIVTSYASLISNALVRDFKMAIAVLPNKKDLAIRLNKQGSHEPSVLTLHLLRFNEEKGDLSPQSASDFLIGEFPNEKEMIRHLKKRQEIRNLNLYATKKDIPTGPLQHEEMLRNEIKLALGLIWATIDIQKNKDFPAPIVAQVLGGVDFIANIIGKRTTK